MADVQRGFPGAIGPFTGPEFSDVASPDAPISYADYNKAVTSNTAAASQLTNPAAWAPVTMAPVPNPVVKPQAAVKKQTTVKKKKVTPPKKTTKKKRRD
jgi:hypothetical protein